MGNCLRTNHKISGEDINEQESRSELAEAVVFKQTRSAISSSSSTTTSPSKLEAKKKNKVRFRLQEDEIIGGDGGGLNDPLGDSKSEVVRIRLVVTQEELKQILNYKKNKDSSVQQLLSEIRLRGRSSVLEVESKSDHHGSWSPVLESVPEDH